MSGSSSEPWSKLGPGSDLFKVEHHPPSLPLREEYARSLGEIAFELGSVLGNFRVGVGLAKKRSLP